jgi:hypothetical protein
MSKAASHSTSKSPRRVKRTTGAHPIERFDQVWLGPFNGRRIGLDITRADGGVYYAPVARDQAVLLALEIFAAVDLFGGLREQERAYLRYVLAEDTLAVRYDELSRRYQAGEITTSEYEQLHREIRENPDPCWPTQTYEEVRRKAAPLSLLDRRAAYEERIAAPGKTGAIQ